MFKQKVNYKWLWHNALCVLFSAFTATAAHAANTVSITPNPLVVSNAIGSNILVTVNREGSLVGETIEFDTTDDSVFTFTSVNSNGYGSATFTTGLTNQVLSLNINSGGTAQIRFIRTNNPDGRTSEDGEIIVLPPYFFTASPDPVSIILNDAAAVTVAVTRVTTVPGGLTGSANVVMASGNTNVFTVAPGTVSFPASTDLTQSTNVVLTGLAEGNTNLTITAAGYEPLFVPVGVSSNPVYSLRFEPSSATAVLAGGGTTTVSLVRSVNVAGGLNSNVTVNLASSDPAVFTVPTSVTFTATSDLSQTTQVQIVGLAAGSGVLTATSSVYGVSAMASVNVINDSVRSLFGTPDPLEIVLSSSTTGVIEIIRSGFLPGDLSAPLSVNILSTDPGVLLPVTNTLIFPAEPTALAQTNRVDLLGIAAGSATLFLVTSSTNYIVTNPEVQVFDQPVLILPDTLSVATGEVATITVSRVSGTASSESVLLSFGSATNARVSADGITYTSAILLNIPAGSNQASFFVRGFSVTAPSIALTASAAGYFSDSMSVIVTDGIDSDFDGMPDVWETFYGLDPFNPLDAFLDNDADDLINLFEFQNSTDPNNEDTDGDGMPDGWEVTHGLNPIVDDAANDPDGDGLFNLQEFLNDTDPFDADTDGDGMPDGWEVANGLNPTAATDALSDADADGLINVQEYELGTDPNNQDSNANGISDYDEDTDGEGVSDGDELNVLFVTSPFLADSNGNGISDYDEDFDGDGLSNGDELYLTLTDPLNANSLDELIPDGELDLDDDNLSNLIEIAMGYNPRIRDTDGNGVSDGQEDFDNDQLSNVSELIIYGTDPLNPDTDDDGARDGDEVTNVTSPLHPMSVYDANPAFNNRARPRSLNLAALGGAGIAVPIVDNRFTFDTKQGWTIEALIRMDTRSTSGEIMTIRSVEGDTILFGLADGSPFGIIRDSLGTAAVTVGGVAVSPIDPDEWIHVAISWSPEDKSMRLYREGLLLIAQQTLYEMSTDPVAVTLGTGFTFGHLDEVRVWDRARSAQEIDRWYQRIYPAPGYVSDGVDGEILPLLFTEFNDVVLLAHVRAWDEFILPSYRPVYAYGQPLIAYYRFDDGGERVEDFAYLGNTNFQFSVVPGALTTSEAANLLGEDDADGDGLAEWWVDLYDLDRYHKEQTGPYHVLEIDKPSDYPITYGNGWGTSDGTEGRRNRIYYNTRMEIVGGQVVKHFNVWQDNAPQLVDSNGAPVLADNYDGKGVYNATGPIDNIIYSDGGWFTPDGTIGQNNAFYNDRNNNNQYDGGEDIWMERGGRSGTYDLQEVVGIEYYRTFVAYGSVGALTGWEENEAFISTKDSSVGRDGAFSAFTKYFELSSLPETSSMEMRLFGVVTNELYVNGSNYVFTADVNGRNTADPDYAILTSLLRLGRNVIYLYTRNAVQVVVEEVNVHYNADFIRNTYGMKFDLSLMVNGEEVIVRGDESVADPRAAWQGHAWSLYTDNRIAPSVRPVADIDGLGHLHPDYGIPNDPDGDGLRNLYELRVNTNPRDADSDNNGVADGAEDYDDDGMSNLDEQLNGADPRLTDTDDDGLPDGSESAGGVANSLIKDGAYQNLALELGGGVNDYLEYPGSYLYAGASWTLEAWIKPAGGSVGGEIIRRSLGSALDHYILSLSPDMVPVISYRNQGRIESLTGGNALPADGATWSHVAATYDNDRREMKLFVNGQLVGFKIPEVAPATSGGGPLIQRVGQGFRGQIDDVRIWSVALSNQDIRNRHKSTLAGTNLALVANFRFDDNTAFDRVAGKGTSGRDDWDYGQVQNFIYPYRVDWLNRWQNAASLRGDAIMLPEESPALDSSLLDSDEDGLPDTWELQYFGDLSQDRTDDYDGDGLNNYYEYLAGLNPINPDTDGDGILDRDEDTDGDGIINGEEQDNYLTHPGLADTDDDNLADSVEVLDETDPLISLSPYVPRMLKFEGPGSAVTLADTTPESSLPRFNLTGDFTIEFYFFLDRLPDAGNMQPLLSRAVNLPGGQRAVTIELGLDQNRIYGRYESLSRQEIKLEAGRAISTGVWYHVAFRRAGNQNTLFVNGSSARSSNTAVNPATGEGDLVLGGAPGVYGKLREIRLWRVARSDALIDKKQDVSLYLDATAIDAAYLDLTGGQEHFRHNSLSDDFHPEFTMEMWIRTTTTDGGVIAGKMFQVEDLFVEGDDEDKVSLVTDSSSFFMRLDAFGTVEAGYTYPSLGQIILEGVIPVNDGEWHHIAYIKTEESHAIYVDGILDSQEQAVPRFDREGPMIIGYVLNADIDEFRLWKRAKSRTSLMVEAQQNLTGAEDDLVTYFHFDNQVSSLEVLNVASRSSGLLATEFDYGVVIPGLTIPDGVIIPGNDELDFILYPFRVVAATELISYLPADDGGFTLEDFTRERDLSFAGIFSGAVSFAPYDGGVKDDRDSDGDGLPDWWETLHGLDVRNANGVDGAGGDPDGDGLNNLYEYLLGLDPRNVDTDGNGIFDGDEDRDGDGLANKHEQAVGTDPLVADSNNNGISDAEEDKDGDGLPNGWESVNGLDPCDSGVLNAANACDGTIITNRLNGALGDPDRDGLMNLAEFSAGTDPLDPDTNKDGISDYDQPAGAGSTLGLIHDDYDGMSPDWEDQYSGSVRASSYDAQLDADGDGWSNYAEYLAGTDPGDPSRYPLPGVNVFMTYAGTRIAGTIQADIYGAASTIGERDAAGIISASLARVDDGIEVFPEQAVTLKGSLSFGDIIPSSLRLQIISTNAPGGAPISLSTSDNGSGELNEEVLSVTITSTEGGNSEFTLTISGTIDYATGEYTLNWGGNLPAVVNATYDTGSTQQFPAERSLTFTSGRLREGVMSAFFYIDNNGNGTYDEGEPGGLAKNQPVLADPFGPVDLEVELRDDVLGYPRFNWPGSSSGHYTVSIVRTSSEGSPQVLSNKVISGRTYFHEGDMLAESIFGLHPGESTQPGYRWFAGGTNGVFHYSWSSSLSAPVIQSPSGNQQLTLTRNQLQWRMSPEAINMRLIIKRGGGSGETIYDSGIMPAPAPDADGLFRMPMPLLAGDAPLTNGTYVWQVQGMSPLAATPFSAEHAFSINLNQNNAGTYTIRGALTYGGYARRGAYVMEAYEYAGFGGAPVARIRLPEQGDYQLAGLSAGKYFVKAYRDQNENGLHDAWEPVGFVRSTHATDPNDKPGQITLPPNRSEMDIVMRDVDLNANRISDAYEYDPYQLPLWNAYALGGEWHWTAWFGYFNTANYPWIYHNEHHWLYHFGPASEDDDSIFVWDDELGTVWWTSSSSYPYLYNFEQGAWLFYDRGSSNPRWFYNYGRGQWESR